MFVPPDGNAKFQFPGADVSRYAAIRPNSTRIHEPLLFRQPRTLNELELQARWFAGEFGRKFKSIADEDIEIVQFGTWNREPGPDFRDAAIRTNDFEPIRGCIEIDLIDRNWELHGHATNPAFDETILHVFVNQSDREFFTRTTANRNVPQVRIDPAVLVDAFRLDHALAKPGRCCAPLRDLPDERIRNILDAAARFRLQRKSAALNLKLQNHGIDEALFQEISGALGYKENKLPFTLIAQRLPLKLLRELGHDREAVLFGAAGFLTTPDLAKFKGPTRNYLRELWDRWWPHRDQFERLILPTSIWKLTSTRPTNHPQRRLAGLSLLVSGWPRFRHSLGKRSVKVVRDFFANLDHPFWRTHFTLAANATCDPMAIIGESRVSEILANVIFPVWNISDATCWVEYAKLPARLTNRRLETGAVRLFGDNPRQKEFLKTVAHQQGLLQIFEDFCLQDNSDCASCPFPEQMKNWN